MTRSSLTQAIQSFEDALRCLKIMENALGYRFVEAAFPTSPKYREHGYPRDVVHLACAAHWTRLQNVLRSPGITMIRKPRERQIQPILYRTRPKALTEKAVLQQRAANMKTSQHCYIAMQKKALGQAG
jgi:hypothetical protein